MEKDEAIAMLKSLIANLEAEHIKIVKATGEETGDGGFLTLLFSGSPLIGRV